MAVVSFSTLASLDDASGTVKRIAKEVIAALPNLRKPPTGDFEINGITHSIALDVSVPPDAYSWIKRVFYGLWCGVCAGRLVTDCLPKFRFEPLSDFGWMRDIASIGPHLRLAGIGFNLAEGAIATFDFGKAIRRFFNATRAVTPELLRAHEEAKVKLLRYRAQQDAQKAMRANDDAGGNSVVPEEANAHDMERPGSEPADNRLADHHSAPPSSDEIMLEPQIPASKLASAAAPSIEECGAYLRAVSAKCEKDEALAELIGNGFAWGRDAVAQGFRGGWDLAWELAKFCGQNVASGVSYAGTALMGAGHIVAGVYERHRASKLIKDVQGAMDAADRCRAEVRDVKKITRLRSASAKMIFRQVQAGRNDWKRFSERVKSWASVRIGYGTFSILLAGGGIAAAILLSGSAVATGGLVLIPLALTVGALWLGHAVRKGVLRNRRNETIKAEKLVVEKVLKELNAVVSAGQEAKHKTLEDWPLKTLIALSRSPTLRQNKYIAAIIATRLLTSDKSKDTSIGDPVALKAERLNASAALQALGMSKTLTGMLKRNAFDDSLKIVVDYMYGGVDIHSHS